MTKMRERLSKAAAEFLLCCGKWVCTLLAVACLGIGFFYTLASIERGIDDIVRFLLILFFCFLGVVLFTSVVLHILGKQETEKCLSGVVGEFFSRRPRMMLLLMTAGWLFGMSVHILESIQKGDIKIRKFIVWLLPLVVTIYAFTYLSRKNH